MCPYGQLSYHRTVVRRKRFCLVPAFGLVALALAMGLSHAGCGTGLPPLTPELQELADALAVKWKPAADLGKSAGPQFEQLLDQGGDPVAAMVAWFSSQPGVQFAQSSNDGIIIVTMDNGHTFTFLTDGRDRSEWNLSYDNKIARPDLATNANLHRALSKNHAAQESCDPKSAPTSRRAFLSAMFQDQFGTDINSIRGSLERSGYVVESLAIDSVVDLLVLREALSDCGVLYFSSHGTLGYLSDNTWANVVSTEIPFPDDPDEIKQLMSGLTSVMGPNVEKMMYVYADRTGLYVALTPHFFSTATYPNSLVYIDTCHSDRNVGDGNTPLREAFLKKGAGAFIGWNGAVHNDIANAVNSDFFESLEPQTQSGASNNTQSILMTYEITSLSAEEKYFVITCQVTPPALGVTVTIHYGPTGREFVYQDRTPQDGAFFTGLLRGGSEGTQWKVIASTGEALDVSTVINAVVANSPVVNDFVAYLPWIHDITTFADFSLHLREDVPYDYRLICTPQTSEEILIDF